MNILLIYPQFPDAFRSCTSSLGFIRKKAAFPPLGLLTVASLLPAEWTRRLVDMNVGHLTDEDLLEADMAFISGTAAQRRSAGQIIARCKALNVTVVAGGPLFSAEPEEFKAADHLVLGEAESTVPAFLSDLQNGRPQKVYRASGCCDLCDTPIPSWDLVKMEQYASMSLQFSRGCPLNCESCNTTVLSAHRQRVKTPQQMIAELDRIYASGWRGNISFVDDNLFGNKDYLKIDLLPALIEWRKDKQGCVFFTEASINLADDPDLLDMMAAAGFDSVFIDIELSDETGITEHRKNRDLLESVATIHHSGLQVVGGFIVGGDSNSPSIFQRQVDFIQKSGIVTAIAGMFPPAPGTHLLDRQQLESGLVNIFSGDTAAETTDSVPRKSINWLLGGYQRN